MYRVFLALLLPITFLAGQGGPPAFKERGPKAGLWREQIVLRLHRMRMERLQQSLGISAEKAKSIADRWEQFDLDGRDRRQRARQLQHQVNDILLSPLSEEEKNTSIRPLVEQLLAVRLQLQELQRKFEEEIRSSLTPAQQGRFMLVAEELQRALMEALRQQKLERGQ